MERRKKRRRSVSTPHFEPKNRHRGPADVNVGASEGYVLKGRFWISKGESNFLAYGRITLLERIKQYGSISRAAKSMEMSYRHAWELVESMNTLASKPLVVTSTGGRGGGGARLTAEGEKMIRLFWEIHKELSEFFQRKQKILKDL